MDPMFDAYYSDSSAPRTPSPQQMHFNPDTHYKQPLDIEPRIYNTDSDNVDDGAVPVDPQYWNNSQQQQNFPYSSRGSLLQELYEHDLAEQQQHPAYLDHNTPDTQSFNGPDHWNMQIHHQQQQQHHHHHQQQQHQQHQQQQQQHHHHHQQRQQDYTLSRRATFPYVKHDRDEHPPLHQYPPFMQQQHQQQQLHDGMRPYPVRQDASLYGEPISEAQDAFIPSMSNSPHQPYHEFDETAIKLEDTSTPLMVPSQQAGFYRPPSSSGCHPMTMSYLSPHTGLPVQHTDDAASKETQYLRRRCFNCHTTEPPSWRRSTLNPGKIVCNKCGLYERTHLRPRPLRFDELRAGNKARSNNKNKGTVSPKTKLTPVKKEQREFVGVVGGGGSLVRRSSVSSSSSVHSGSGASDWDDNVSVYSAGSAPPTSFNSPNAGTFPLSRDDSQSPPRDGGIRLPNAPLSDLAIATGNPSQQPLPPSPRKAHTAPYFSPPPSANMVSSGGLQQQQQAYYRRGSVSQQQSPPQQQQEPTNWQGGISASTSPQSSLDVSLPATTTVGEPGNSPSPLASLPPPSS